MPSASALDLRLNRSAWQRRFLAAGHVLAAIAVLAAGLHWLVTVSALAAVGISAWRGWHAPTAQSLSFRPGAGWRIADSRRRVITVRRLAGAHTGRYVTSIAWGRRGGLALFDDAFCDTGHKQLRRLLRHSDTFSPC